MIHNWGEIEVGYRTRVSMASKWDSSRLYQDVRISQRSSEHVYFPHNKQGISSVKRAQDEILGILPEALMVQRSKAVNECL